MCVFRKNVCVFFGMSTTVVRRESCSAKRSLASRRGAPRLLEAEAIADGRSPKCSKLK